MGVGGMCYSLSLTSTNNILATLFDNRKLKEYTPKGVRIIEINLNSSMEYSWYSIQLSSDRFVVSHGGGGSLHRVCLVDTSGRIIQCYGGAEGSGVEQLSRPSQLAVDGYGNVLVADNGNGRVVLLSPSLTHLGYIMIPAYEMFGTHLLHLDEINRRLYIGVGRVFVLGV